MEPSVLHSQIESFDEHDSFLYFVLGLISVSRRLIDQLEAEADRTAEPADSTGAAEQKQEPITRILI